MIIDSCIDRATNTPAASNYLKAIGADLATDVQLVIATHWHDDHIRGLARVFEECSSARFCCSSALGSSEFLAMVRAYNTRPVVKAGPGVREIDTIIDIVESRRLPIKTASSDRAVFKLDAHASGHGQDVVVTTLSPSDAQYSLFLVEIASLIPGIETKRRAVAQSPNHLTVVTLIQVGNQSFLFGGDLENGRNEHTGWEVIVKSNLRPKQKAAVFKIAHHGSENAHHDQVWSEMLIEAPFAIMTPWNRSSKLPTAGDIERIVALTPHAYITAPVVGKRKKVGLAAVNKTLTEMNVQIREAEATTGAVRLRNGGAAASEVWTVELHNTAQHLKEIIASVS